MPRHPFSWLMRLPFGEVTRRALEAVEADAQHEKRAAVHTGGPLIRAARLARVGWWQWLALLRVIAWSFGIPGEHPMRNLSQDVRHGWRRLAAAPAFTLFAVVSLALGIGATTAIYSVVHALVYQPIPIRDLDRVVNIYHSRPPGAGHLMSLSRPDYEDLKRQQTSFSVVAAWRRHRGPVALPAGRSEVLVAEAVSGEYFDLIGLRPQAGRLIQRFDDTPGAPPVMVISDAFWEAQFARAPGAVGATVRLAGQPVQVIGVAAREFRGVNAPNVLPPPFWISLSTAASLADRDRDDGDREARTLFVKARLKDDRTVDEAVTDVGAIATRLDQAFPIGEDDAAAGRQGTAAQRRARRDPQWSRPWVVVPATAFRMHESVDRFVVPISTALIAAVGLVLLIACTNLTNLVLARASGRTQEIAVRLALGASRARLIREHLVESAMIVAAGAIVAVGLAQALMIWMAGGVRMAPGILLQVRPQFNLPVAGALLTAALVAVAVIGLVPALRASRTDVRSSLASGGTSGATPRWRGRRLLIGAQVLVSTVLLALAALAVEQLGATRSRDVGYDIDRLAAAEIDFAASRIPEVRAREIRDRLRQDARLLPAARSVAMSSVLPVGRGIRWGRLATADGGAPMTARIIDADPALFETMGVRMLAGQAFGEASAALPEPVVVLSASAADRLFGQENPIGQVLALTLQPTVERPEPAARPLRVVGLVEDTDVGSVGNRNSSVAYLPFDQEPVTSATIVVRTDEDPSSLVPALRRLVEAADPALVVIDAGTARTLSGADGLASRIMASVVGLLGVVASALAMAGLYGVLTQITRHRVREIGLRMALGADARTVARMVLRQGLGPVVLGLAGGLVLGAASQFWLAPALFLSPLLGGADSRLVLVVPLIMVAAGGAACWLPARRAARVDPTVALRES